MWPVLLTALTAFLAAALAVGWLCRPGAAALALDRPNARSLHSTPVPRTGGLGLALGLACAWPFTGAALPGPVWAGLAVVFSISLLDDLRGLPAAIRLAAHLAAAACAVYALIDDPLSPAALLAVFAIGWMSNLYNFMDGSDGLAGGMAVAGFSAYALAAWDSGDSAFALANLAVAAAAGGFLIHNFHPARIFLGDAGSVPLGFLAAALGLAGWQQGLWNWWFPPLVFSPFIVDASVTLLRRLAAGTRVWEAHRDHYYQRLVRLGLGHRNTALAEYVLMLGCAGAALWGLSLDAAALLGLLLAAAAVYLALILAIERAWRIRGLHHA